MKTLDEAVVYCGINELYSMNDIRNACNYMNQYNVDMRTDLSIVPNYKPICNPEVMNVTTQKRNLLDYDIAGGDPHE